MYLLDGSGSGTWAEPLPDLDTKLFTYQCHAMYTERTEGGRVVKKPRKDLHICCVVGSVDGLRRFSPVYRSIREL